MFTDSHSIKAYRPILTSILTYNFHFFLQFSVQNSVTCDNPWHYTCFTWLMISKVHSIFIRIKPIRFISASSSWAPQEPTDNLTTIANTTFKFVEKNWKCNKLMKAAQPRNKSSTISHTVSHHNKNKTTSWNNVIKPV